MAQILKEVGQNCKVRPKFLVTLQAALAMEALLELLEKSDCRERDLKGNAQIIEIIILNGVDWF